MFKLSINIIKHMVAFFIFKFNKLMYFLFMIESKSLLIQFTNICLRRKLKNKNYQKEKKLKLNFVMIVFALNCCAAAQSTKISETSLDWNTIETRQTQE
jgi:hypothetical protein